MIQSIVVDLIYKNSSKHPWCFSELHQEQHGEGESFFFNDETHHQQCLEAPANYYQLNIKERLKEFNPNLYCSLQVIGYYVKKILLSKGIDKFYSLEGRVNDEIWHTINVIYIPKKEYDRLISTIEDQMIGLEDYFECPLSHNLMKEPFIGSDGYTYEKEAIFKWLDKSKTSPLTSVAMKKDSLRPNHLIENMKGNTMEKMTFF